MRKVWHPAYKQSREKTAEEMVEMQSVFEQMKLLRTWVLPRFGFRNVFYRVGYEADDLIAAICRDNSDEDIAIVSSDNDLYQLLTDKHYMYNIAKKRRYTHIDFTREWGIESRQWARVKSLAGCRGDSVPGVEGIGDKTAIRYIKGELSEGSKVYQKIEQGRMEGVVATAKFLTELPFPGLGSFDLEEREVFELRDFFDICDEYGFRSFAAQEMTWREQFNMKMERVGNFRREK